MSQNVRVQAQPDRVGFRFRTDACMGIGRYVQARPLPSQALGSNAADGAASHGPERGGAEV